MSAAGPPANYRVITFYSYKGGVGRSMALANVAALLAQMGRRVLAVDFDLEAPGLARYFEKDQTRLLQPRSATTGAPGLVDLILAYADGKPIGWRDCVVEVHLPSTRTPIDFIPAGRIGSDYAARVQSLNWDKLFQAHEFGEYLNQLREEWRDAYDIVLVDSRTGMSDVGGICTIILPDALVVLFTANNQSIDGTAEVVRRARSAQETLPVERSRLLAIPMLSRDDRRTEYEQSELWRKRIAEVMNEFFRDWVMSDVRPSAVLDRLYLPQVAYWSFGERLPVIERPSELDDPGTLCAAYWRLASLIDADLDWEGITESPSAARALSSFGKTEEPERRSLFARVGPWASLVFGLLGIAAAIWTFVSERPSAPPTNSAPPVNSVAPSSIGTSSIDASANSGISRQAASAPRVYIQIQDSSQRAGAEALRQALNATAFHGGTIDAPEIELLTSPQSRVSYTQLRCVQGNCKDAGVLAAMISKLLGGAAIPVRNISAIAEGSTVRPGTYELWFGPGPVSASEIPGAH